jgi:hypothetical protein
VKVFEENREILLRRYPKFTFFLRGEFLNENFKKSKNFFKLKEAEVLYICGFDFFDRYPFFKKWLDGKRERALVFIEEEEEVFFKFLCEKSASKFLKNPKVHLFFRFKEEDEDVFLENIVKDFPARKIEVKKSKNFKRGRFLKIRKKLIEKTVFFNASHVDSLYYFSIFKNIYENLKNIKNSFFLNSLEGKFKKIPAVICGAGPSLYEEREVLKKIGEKAVLIAGGSAITALSKYGITPHFASLIDPNFEEFLRLKNASIFEIPILYSPRVHYKVFKTFNGILGYLSSTIGGGATLFAEKKLNIKSKMIDKHLSRDAFSVTTLNVAIAHFLGCDPIILCGVDLAYTKNRRYSKGILKEGGEKGITGDMGDLLLKKRDRKGEGVFTNRRWLMESSCISSYAKKFKNVGFINATIGGIGFKGIEFKSLKEIEKSLKKQIDLKGYVHSLSFQSYFDIKEKKIENFLKDMKRSLIFCKNHVDTLICELKKLLEEKSEKRETALMILAKFEMKGEMAYRYLIGNSKKASDDLLKRFYKPWDGNFSRSGYLNMELNGFENFKEIIERYLEVMDN